MGETEDVKALPEADAAPPEPLDEGVLTPDDIAGLTDAFRRELLYIPEWGKSVWVWAYDLNSERNRWAAMQIGADDSDKVNRGMVARVIEAVRVSGEAAEGGGPPAKLFDREKHWKWLFGQPMAVLQRICEKSQQLNQETAVTQEQMLGFFAILASVVSCLRSIASRTEVCTDCPANSQGTCPLVASGSLWLPTG